MNSLTSLVLDLQAPNLAVVAAGKQNDLMSRKIAATLRDGDVAFIPPTGVAATIRYAKPDGTAGWYDVMEDGTTPAYSISGNVITFILAEQMLTVPGRVPVEINFYTGTERLTTFSFMLTVEKSVLTDNTIISSDYYNVLTDQVAQAVAAAEEAAEIAANLPKPSDAAPQPLGPAAPGVSALYSRADHVHPIPSASDVGALPRTTTPADIGAVSTDDVKYKIYNSVTDLGLTSGSATISGAYATLPIYSVLIAQSGEFASSERPSGFYGTILMVKSVNAFRGYIEAKGDTIGRGDYRMGVDVSTGVPTGTWVRVPIPVSGLFQVKTKSTTAQNINATNSQWQAVTPDTITGYSVVGIVGWRIHCDNAALWAYTVIYDKTNNRAHVALRNPTSAVAQNCYVDFDILYVWG